jgi:serine/threonine protein kinase
MKTVPETIGRYRIVGTIGQGGMGRLYLAVDPQLDRRVAIKLLKEGFDDADMRERFMREARTIAQLRHINIISIFDVGEDNGCPFIAMEHIAGQSLAEVIHGRLPLSVNRKLEIIDALCSALSYAHRSGIVHRDIKPANVMIDSDGVVKVLDFGIARLSGSDMTRPGIIIGTINYMAPEQIEGRAADARSDIFSVGAVCYELLSLRQAFPGDLIAVLAKIVHGAPEPLDELMPELDSEIISVVRCALNKDPATRYQDFAEMRRDLRAVQQRLPEDLHVDAPAVSAESDVATLTGVRNAQTATALPPLEEPEVAAGDTVYLNAVAEPHVTDDVPDVQLFVVRSGDTRMNSRVVPVRTRNFRIGRDAGCDLSLADRLLSRLHATIEYGPDGFVVRDAGSVNGTFLNGRRVKGSEVEPLYFGTTIQLGDTLLTFTLSRDVKLPDFTGCSIAGRYTLTRLIRDSPKGAVYTALDTKLAKDVAVKLLSPELMRFATYREQFAREADIGATLHHPHICQVLDRGYADISPPVGLPLHVNYLCLDMMAGGNLQDRIHVGAVHLDLIATWVERVADALDYAHRHGVIHGDVKPSAIVFNEDDYVYLTDFAFAQRALSERGRPAIGAPPYMAPEVWEHGSLTTATDQFALGIVTYYAIAGRLPFAGQENPEVRRKNFMLGAVPVHQEAATYREEVVPRAISEVLARALSRMPEKRFASMKEFASAVAAAVQGHRKPHGAAGVFLSYQRDVSSGWANYFAKELKDHGIATFLDVQRPDRAEQFPPRLARAIEECDVFVCLLGSTTLQSKWVIEEIHQAHRHAKPMIPIFQESFDPSTARSTNDAAVATLLSYDAVHLFDLRNVHVRHSAEDLAHLVKNTVFKLES